jgi:hypothetical protein
MQAASMIMSAACQIVQKPGLADPVPPLVTTFSNAIP